MTQNTTYVAYRLSNGTERIGSLDFQSGRVQPLSFSSGAPITNLYQVIEIGSEKGIIADGETFDLSSVQLLPPISGRDVLAVGKNYAAHATEFHKSGYDKSDTVDQPTHPVIFTKRATSIIAHGESILPHEGFTESVDYEGEIGVIVGKPGFRISQANALDHVWGYTIINDVTARERQRDHKQFFLGKSPDTFCPIGPVAVPKEALPKTLRVETSVKINGASEKRQDGTTEDLIYSIPYLIEAISHGQTLQIGDVLATGTPAGVGFGQDPPAFLNPGDEVSISVTGLGTLTNKIASFSETNPTPARVRNRSYIPLSNSEKSLGATVGSFVRLNSKPLHYMHLGQSSGPPLVFVHGLGGSSESFMPLITALKLEATHSLHLLDLEGHGMSPTRASSVLTISSFADDILALLDYISASQNVTLIAHSMGCLVAMQAALGKSQAIAKLVLLGPPPNPLPEAGASGSISRAATVRKGGMEAVAGAVATAGTSQHTKDVNPLAVAAVRLSLLGQDPEGYAKACTALAGSAKDKIDVGAIKAKTFLITGGEDKVSPQAVCEAYSKSIPTNDGLVVLPNVGHWHIYEDLNGVANAVGKALGIGSLKRAQESLANGH